MKNPNFLIWLILLVIPENFTYATPIDGASEHNLVRNAISNGTTITISSFNYNFSQAPRPSSILSAMSHDAGIANAAQTHAEKCVFEHSSPTSRNKNGENIFASTDSVASIENAVGSWASEVINYNYSTNSCEAGKMCGHYTQIAWDDSTKVGCARQTCTTPLNDSDKTPLFGGASSILIVCQYSQPGNFIGEKPYEM